MKDIHIPPNASEADELRARFLITCRLCGSTDVAINFREGRTYSEHSSEPSTVQFGCNACGQNDFYASL